MHGKRKVGFISAVKRFHDNSNLAKIVTKRDFCETEELFMQQVKLISADDCLKFALSGEIDSATSEDFYAQVCAAYEHDKKSVLFDCAALTFIDSTTLGTFVKILKKLRADGFDMALEKVRPNVKKLFDICALNTIMEIRQ